MKGWDPFEGGFGIIERFGGRFESGWPFDADAGEETDASFVPAADLFVTPEGLSIEVELPGVKPSSVVVRLNAGVVVVEAERVFSRAGGREVKQLEGRWGRMRREFALPYGARPEQMLAELRGGVLRVFVPCEPVKASVERRVRVQQDEDRGQGVSIH